MKIVYFAAVLCFAHADGSWRYYPSGNQQWSLPPGQNNYPHRHYFNPPGQPFNSQYQNDGNVRFGNYPAGSNPWLHPNSYNSFVQSAIREAEWVCRNSQTGDMLLISADEENVPTSGNGPERPETNQPQHPSLPQPQQPQQPLGPGQYPWNQVSTPQPGHNLPDQSNNMWNNPFLNGDSRTSTPEKGVSQITSTEEPVTHHGEGQIDVRMGE